MTKQQGSRANSNGKEVGFGNGLAIAAEQPREMWSAMVAQVAATENPSVEVCAASLAWGPSEK
jgi:hypothetical protein